MQKSPVAMKSSKGRSIREVKNLDSPKPKKITGKVSTEDIKVIAATSTPDTIKITLIITARVFVFICTP
jgi:hypothetical protein